MEKENKVYVMTAKQAAKAFPLDKELYARLGELIDAGYEPEIDDEHPEMTGEDPRFVEVKSDFQISDLFRNPFRQILAALFSH